MKIEFHDLDLIRSKEEPDATNVEIAPIRPRRMDACADMETAVKGMVAGAYNSANARTKPRRDSSYRYVRFVMVQRFHALGLKYLPSL